MPVHTDSRKAPIVINCPGGFIAANTSVTPKAVVAGKSVGMLLLWSAVALHLLFAALLATERIAAGRA